MIRSPPGWSKGPPLSVPAPFWIASSASMCSTRFTARVWAGACYRALLCNLVLALMTANHDREMEQQAPSNLTTQLNLASCQIFVYIIFLLPSANRRKKKGRHEVSQLICTFLCAPSKEDIDSVDQTIQFNYGTGVETKASSLTALINLINSNFRTIFVWQRV